MPWVWFSLLLIFEIVLSLQRCLLFGLYGSPLMSYDEHQFAMNFFLSVTWESWTQLPLVVVNIYLALAPQLFLDHSF